jgi:ribonuclease VapC
MVLDTSAVIAAIGDEEGAEELVDKMDRADHLAIGTPTLVEATVVLVRRYGPDGLEGLFRFLNERQVVFVAFEDQHREVAGEAFIRYGKGRHPASLNYGDCMTYATAKVADQPLLFTGNDFARTDIAPA